MEHKELLETIVTRACGLDVHKDTIKACIMRQGIKKQIKTYGTNTDDLQYLKSWLEDNDISHVAMESTGVFWKPVFNILGDKFEIILVNDGSRDRSWSIINNLVPRFSFVKGLNLMRNYGRHNALLAGIRTAGCDIIITLDDDFI